MDEYLELFDNAVSNVAYYLSISKDRVSCILKSLLEDEGLEGYPLYWFLHSLCKNENISLKPFEENISDNSARTILLSYLEKHEAINFGSKWMSYTGLWGSQKTKISLSKKLDYSPTQSAYSVRWTSILSRHPSMGNTWDYLRYPSGDSIVKLDKICVSIFINWVSNLSKVDIVDLKRYLNIVSEKFFEYEKGSVKVYKVIGDDNPEFYRYLMTTAVGIDSLISIYPECIRLSKSYFESSGFVFNRELPLMPYGFDLIAARNGISCYSKPTGLWKV